MENMLLTPFIRVEIIKGHKNKKKIEVTCKINNQKKQVATT